jgi:hypothetical protein
MKIKPIIVFLLVFGTLFFACETNKSNVNPTSDLIVIAKDSSEGIHLYIDNIPEDAMYLFVTLYDITTNDRLYTGSHFKNNELELLKITGFLICPFVKYGHEYEIIVDASILTEENMKTIKSSSITAIANGGIHIINNPTLDWNNSDNIITLSERPIFSDKAINSQNNGLNYGLGFINEKTNGKVGGNINELTNELLYDNTQNFNAIVEMIGNIGLSGDIPIYADVSLSLEYENIKWTVEFAKTEEIHYSL